MNATYQTPRWMKSVLLVAGVYNLIWGLLAVVAPQWMLSVSGVNAGPVAFAFWQCIGMIVGVYGVGYIIAAKHPFHHWPITLVGLLGKILGPAGFILATTNDLLPATMVWTIVANDLIWWIPFTAILWGAVRHHRMAGSAYATPEADDPLRELRTNSGRRLDDLADQQPQLVMFLRHAGCTFCRQALSDLSKQRAELEQLGVGIVLVHLGEEEPDTDEFFGGYGMDDLPRISDPECRLYRQFGLDLGGFSQLFGLRVWLRGLVAGLLNGHGIGAARGNTFQMPGAYVYHHGQISAGFRHNFASDRPDYVELIQHSGVTAAHQPSFA